MLIMKNIFYPIQITNTIFYITSKRIAYPTKSRFEIYNGDWYILFVDKDGINYSVNECIEFTKYTILSDIYDVDDIEKKVNQ